MKTLQIVHLYPQEMNIYGDTGNRIVLEQRLNWRGIPYEISRVGTGDALPKDADIIIGGGGQDAGQQVVEADLLSKSVELQAMANDGVVMLMICGMYQLFGQAFITSDNLTIKGAGILPVFTQAGEERLIGNIIVSTQWGDIVGYENHSGKTYLESGCIPFGRVKKGAGNNGEDRTEGARYHNVFASYMHGPILSKNPNFADLLLSTAMERSGQQALGPLDDELEHMAARLAAKRPR